MTRARFAAKQEPVTVTQIDGVNYFQICLHEQEVQTQSGMGPEGKGSEPVTEYEYDFNEWHDSTTDPEAVKASPADYLQYVPTGVKTEEKAAKPSTLEQRITDLEDMVADVYGGGEA